MLKEILENVRKTKPLIHSITNYVSMNDCANLLLACGASPIMAEDPLEVEEITTRCSGLYLNIGTLNQQKVSAMVLAGKKANALGHTVVLDPVGAGASTFRSESAKMLLDKIHFSAIRGNLSEIKSLALDCENVGGVDVAQAECVTEENLEQVADFAKKFAKKTGAIIVITGQQDIVADERNVYLVSNGHTMLRNITGVGCQLSALIAAYITANPGNTLEAVLAAVCAMGVCGEKSYNRLKPEEGSGTYRMYLMDAVNLLNGDELEQLAKYKKYN